VHGCDGYPEEGWFPWLKKELEQKGFTIQVPSMPNPAEPKIETWISHLSKTVGDVDENTYFIGHGIGCQTILRYIEKLPSHKKVGGLVFVAGWFILMNLENDKVGMIAAPWLETPIDFEKIKNHTKNIFAIFSDNDQFVSLENKKIFEEKLSAKTAVEHNKGHFSGEDGVKEMPYVLVCLESISRSIISVDDFKKCDIRIGKVIRAERIPNSDKLLKLIFDLGSEERQILAGIAEAYPDPSVLVGREMPVIVNLEPRTMRGEISNGMILAADNAGHPVLLAPIEEVPPGSVVK